MRPLPVKSVLTALIASFLAACANDPSPPSTKRKLPPKPVVSVHRAAKETQSVAPSEQRCLALNLYWEARGEGRDGMYAVGWTVLNRVNSPKFPSDVCGVIYQGGETPPCQFSWWCDGRSDHPREQRAWVAALSVSDRLLSNPPPDPTGGALFYHNTSIRSPWTHSRRRTARIGRHVFYR